MIYLDNAATTYPKPEVVYSALDIANRKYGFNSGRGSYKEAKNTAKIVDNAREELADLINVEKGNVVFATSATEALNMVIFGLDWKEGDNVYVSPFEHNSVMRPLYELKKRYNINIRIIPFCIDTWSLSSEEFSDMIILNKPKCVICSAKSNVTGYKLPVKEIFEISKKYSSINILDAAQSFGVDKRISNQNTDFIIFAGHKSLYASFGIAGFLNINNISLNSLIFGGTGSDSLNLEMPEKGVDHLEAGSKNIVAIYGLLKSTQWVKENDIEAKEIELSNYLYTALKRNKRIKIYAPTNYNNCSGIISFNVEGYLAEEVGNILDEEYDICVRTGYHCCPYVHDFIGSKEFNGTVRVSFNYFNTKEEIDKLVEALDTL